MSFEEKPAAPRSDLANAGMYAFRRSVLDVDRRTGHRSTSAADLLPQLVGRARSPCPSGTRSSSTSAPRKRSRAPRRSGPAGGRVIITQTPLRVGLVGGGTDLPAYYREHGGRVLNAAIDKYVYVVVKQRFDDDIYVNYSRKEIVSRVEDVEHDLVREAMHMAGVRGGVEITTLADIPVGRVGTRLVVVGDRRAAPRAVRLPGTSGVGRGARRAGLHHRDRPLPQADRQAGPVRRGVRRDLRPALRPRRRASTSSRSTSLPTEHRRFQDELMLFYTGITRSADTILGEQKANIAERLPQLRAAAGPRRRGGGRAAVRATPTAVGIALVKSWEAKRQLARASRTAPSTRPSTRRLRAGATGAKVTGAGGGGFVLVLCPVEHQEAVRTALAPMKELPITIDPYGSRVIFNVHRDIWG